MSYDVEFREDHMGAYIKRLMVAFRRPGRSVRLNLETHLERIEVRVDPAAAVRGRAVSRP
jgi:hypothetical protein